MSNRPQIVPCLIAGAMLIAGVADWPYGYYQLLRLVTCAAAVYAAYHAYPMKRQGFIWTFIFVAILFNPVFSVHLDKEIWQPIDIITGIVFGIFAFVKSGACGSNQNKPIPSLDTDPKAKAPQGETENQNKKGTGLTRLPTRLSCHPSSLITISRIVE